MKTYLSLSINERINLKGVYFDENNAGRIAICVTELQNWGLNAFGDNTSMPYHKAMDCNGYYN